MVVNMIKRRRKFPLLSMKVEATIIIRCLKGLENDGNKNLDGLTKLMVGIKWKGSPKSNNVLRALGRKSVKREYTREECLRDDGVVHWDEEFSSVCGFSGLKEKGYFNPWELEFIVFNVSNAGQKRKVADPMVLNLAEFASTEEANVFDINVPLTLLSATVAADCTLSLSLFFSAVETSEQSEWVSMATRFLPCLGAPVEKAQAVERLTFKRGLKKVKSLTDFISSRKSKKSSNGEESSDGKFSTGSEESEYPFDTDSFNDTDEGESDGSSTENGDILKSFGYGSLVLLNLAGRDHGSGNSCEDEDRLYYSSPKAHVNDQDSVDAAEVEQFLKQSQKLGILNWRKKRLSSKTSPKKKGEPLLKKEYGEEGGDDIDFDRRQLSSSDEYSWHSKTEEKSTILVSEFGDDDFTIGCWEFKELVSRDGCMKLRTQVFFGSIDQRNERAAGESACTALVAVIADWVHSNKGLMPIKSDFDRLIREGSLQWRNLCDNEAFKDRFPDKHFDLETVIETKIRPLSVIHAKSYVGFFHPEGLNEEGFDFLHGTMSFDSIWDNEISQTAEDKCDSDDNHCHGDPLVYIVSWNDHFFILMVDRDAYYIIDTLGERLYEGCNQAYILKFDRDTTIMRILKESTEENNQNANSQPLPETPSGYKKATDNTTQPESVAVVVDQSATETNTVETGEAVDKEEEEEVLVCSGKESCKEYIKSFLAAIPIRELQADLKRGLMASTPLHHWLQIEFHHTEVSPPAAEEIIMTSEMQIVVEPEVEVEPSPAADEIIMAPEMQIVAEPEVEVEPSLTAKVIIMAPEMQIVAEPEVEFESSPAAEEIIMASEIQIVVEPEVEVESSPAAEEIIMAPEMQIVAESEVEVESSPAAEEIIMAAEMQIVAEPEVEVEPSHAAEEIILAPEMQIFAELEIEVESSPAAEEIIMASEMQIVEVAPPTLE